MRELPSASYLCRDSFTGWNANKRDAKPAVVCYNSQEWIR